MGFVDTVLSALGMGDRESGASAESSGPPDPEFILQIRTPEEGNAIWESFESIELRLAALSLEATDGTTADLAVAGSSNYRDEAYLDGDDAVYQLAPAPATYESGTVTLEVLDYELQDGASDLGFEGFEDATVDFGGETFEPEPGEEGTFTLVVTVRAEEDAYVLEPALEW